MELDLIVVGAFDTLAAPEVTDAALRAEITRRNVSEADAALAVDHALLRGIVVRAASGGLRRGDPADIGDTLVGEAPRAPGVTP